MILSRTLIVMGDSCVDEPGPPLFEIVDAANFLSSPFELASLLQNMGQQRVFHEFFSLLCGDRARPKLDTTNKLFLFI